MPYHLLIDGRLVDGASSSPVINPATGEAFAESPRADKAQLDAAVAGAKAAFPGWAALGYAERRRFLEAFADAIAARQDEFGRLLTLEQGRPFPQAVYEVARTVQLIRYFAAQSFELETLKDEPGSRILRQRSPLGVVAAITPWNFPLLLLATKIAPGLIVGNTMIAKPAPTTSLTTLLLGEVAAGTLPPGVLSTLADDNDLGPELTAHLDIAKVAFTGSTATGKTVMRSVSSTLKRLTLELGGNDAALVLDDADVKEVAPKLLAAATMNAGQVCLATKRVYVPRSLYADLCDELAMLAKQVTVGDGMQQGSQLGPIQNRAQFDKARDYLADARLNGRVLAGGEALDQPGFFIPPTIVCDIADDARLVREEQFSPILPILAYDTVDEAITRANTSEYGLSGTVWTKDVQRGLDVALKIETGTVWINKHLDVHLDVPLGGAKQSGMGREYGLEGMQEYTQEKIINIGV